MTLDLAVSLGDILTTGSMLVAIGIYIIDTRYSAGGARRELTELRSVLHDLRETIEGVAANVDKVARENASTADIIRREVGETMLAHREKLREVELFVRDNFVRNDALRDMSNNFQNQLVDLRAAMMRIEQRLTDH